jgi:hypothetical protein
MISGLDEWVAIVMQQRNKHHPRRGDVDARVDVAWNVESLLKAIHFLNKKMAGMHNKSYSINSYNLIAGISDVLQLLPYQFDGFLFDYS